MRTLGRPSASTVASAIAFGSLGSPASASPSQARAIANGSSPAKMPSGLPRAPPAPRRTLAHRAALEPAARRGQGPGFISGNVRSDGRQSTPRHRQRRESLAVQLPTTNPLHTGAPTSAVAVPNPASAREKGSWWAHRGRPGTPAEGAVGRCPGARGPGGRAQPAFFLPEASCSVPPAAFAAIPRRCAVSHRFGALLPRCAGGPIIGTAEGRSAMRAAVRAGVAYFALVFAAGFLLGG